jgi:hypothetical protein
MLDVVVAPQFPVLSLNRIKNSYIQCHKEKYADPSGSAV